MKLLVVNLDGARSALGQLRHTEGQVNTRKRAALTQERKISEHERVKLGVESFLQLNWSPRE